MVLPPFTYLIRPSLPHAGFLFEPGDSASARASVLLLKNDVQKRMVIRHPTHITLHTITTHAIMIYFIIYQQLICM